jgi:hypothetical protein
MRALGAAVLFLVSSVSAAAAPRLGVEGTRFTVDGAPRFLVFISYFDGIRRVPSGVQDDLEYLKTRVDGIRVFPNWWVYACPPRSGADTLFDLQGEVRPAAWTALDTLLSEAGARGLIVDLSFSRESVTDNGSPPRRLDPDAYQRALTTIVGSTAYLKGRYPHVLIDVQNEWPIHSDKVRVEALLTALRAADPNRLLVASSSGGGYAPVGLGLPLIAAAYHDPRERDWHSAGTARRIVEAVRRSLGGAVQPIYLQEPMPWGAVCPRQDHDSDPAHFAAALANARAAGAAAWTLHTRATFDLKSESLVSKLNDTVAAGLKQVLDHLQRPNGRDTNIRK